MSLTANPGSVKDGERWLTARVQAKTGRSPKDVRAVRRRAKAAGKAAASDHSRIAAS